MADVPKSKRARKWDDEAIAFSTSTGEFDREETASNRRILGNQIRYQAPEAGDKTRALYALGLMDLSNGAKAVGAALIWHANSKTGRCDPGLQRLTYETHRSRRTVINAIDELGRKSVVRKMRRGQSTNAYHINWRFLASRFKGFESRVTSVRFLKQECKDLHLASAEPCTSEVQKRAPEPIKLTHEGNPCHEVAHPPSASDAHIPISPVGQKEGKQGKEVETPEQRHKRLFWESRGKKVPGAVPTELEIRRLARDTAQLRRRWDRLKVEAA
jgi:Helix-turn-helix domain